MVCLMNDVGLWFAVQQFLFREARLLDERRFDEWLDLFTADTRYWMPGRFNPGATGQTGVTVPGELALMEDTKKTLTTRVARLATGMAWSEEPPSRTRHLITNVTVERAQNPGELLVHSNFLIYRTRLEREIDTYVGQREDILRETDGSWKIACRTILLDQSVLSTSNLSVFF